MKTIKTTLFILAAIFTSGLAYATGNLNVNFAPAEAGSATLEISNATETTFKIEVMDDMGTVLFEKETSEPATDYKRLYDFSELEDGNYFLTVKIDNERVIKDLKIDNGKIELVDKSKMIAPYFAFTNDVFKMSYLNFHDGDMKIYVYQNDANLYEKTLEPGFTVHKALDFSKLDNGIYDIVFASGESLYEYKVVKD